MNIFDEFNKANAGLKDLNNFFVSLYYIKRYMLMIENIHGESALRLTSEQTKILQSHINDIETLPELSTFEKFYELALKDIIPSDKLDEWETSDYEEFTNGYHHRKFWNEIENNPIIDMFIVRFCELYGGCKIYTDETYNKSTCLWNLRLYDFNDYDLYFTSMEDLENFTDQFEIEPYTVSSRTPDKDIWHEEYSV